jgi:hypothetical protein
MVSDAASEQVNWHQDFSNFRSKVKRGDGARHIFERVFENGLIKA